MYWKIIVYLVSEECFVVENRHHLNGPLHTFQISELGKKSLNFH